MSEATPPNPALTLEELKKAVETKTAATEQAAEAVNQITTQGQPTTESAANAAGWSPELVTHLGLGLLIFSILLMGLIGFLIYKEKITPPLHDGQWLVRTLVIPICVIAAVFLVITGYSQDQIAPVIGLLGTIIGYLLGAGTRTPPDTAAQAPTR
ncbi:hypothetical protein EI77_04583 [Prosthecobacter fusiformis]|uniref:Uncharacterized protein n=1 Tax=Prosthecobacter fusiformis TaxID=48464 RepID=A0A4R7RJY9_9BACT|nr:hypothetical protein [Prosthecobacter fusiformis]TDU63062.1 hypothetical protein EI77_04583 [Prosthecobacter fusiformis]